MISATFTNVIKFKIYSLCQKIYSLSQIYIFCSNATDTTYSYMISGKVTSLRFNFHIGKMVVVVAKIKSYEN